MPDGEVNSGLVTYLVEHGAGLFCQIIAGLGDFRAFSLAELEAQVDHLAGKGKKVPTNVHGGFELAFLHEPAKCAICPTECRRGFNEFGVGLGELRGLVYDVDEIVFGLFGFLDVFEWGVVSDLPEELLDGLYGEVITSCEIKAYGYLVLIVFYESSEHSVTKVYGGLAVGKENYLPLPGKHFEVARGRHGMPIEVTYEVGHIIGLQVIREIPGHGKGEWGYFSDVVVDDIEEIEVVAFEPAPLYCGALRGEFGVGMLLIFYFDIQTRVVARGCIEKEGG